MTERQIGDPIEWEALEARRQKTLDTIDDIEAIIQPNLEASVPLFGKAFLGSDTKVVRDAKGRRKRVPITYDDISEYLDRTQLETEERFRQALIKKAQFALDAQSNYYGRSKIETRRQQSQEIIDFTRALIDRFQELPLPNCGWEWQKKEPTFARDEKTLEEFCKITLKDTPALQSDMQADLIPSADLLDTRNPSAWNAIVQRQRVLFKGYIEDVVRQKAKSAKNEANFAARITIEGKPVYSQEQVDAFDEVARNTQNTAQQVEALSSFSNILPYFQAEAGKPLTFHELLVSEASKK